MPRKIFSIFSAVVLISLSACSLFPFLQVAPPGPGQAETNAAETLQPYQTELAFQSTSTSISAPTNTPVTPTSIPTITRTPTSTQTSIPSLTPFPTATSRPVFTNTPASTATQQTPCNRANFIGDVTIPDGTQLPPNMQFTKIWRIQNTGTCTWDQFYKIVFVSGDRMRGRDTPLPRVVQPGDVVDLAVNLETPSRGGVYKGDWKLSDGFKTFGSGSNANLPFWVLIRVVPNLTGVVQNFALSMCTARWESSAGLLPCPGNQNSDKGFAIQVTNPNLESGRENGLALVTFPERTQNGWIAGTFPQLTIENGYRFISDIGCLAGYPRCDIDFELYAREGNDPMVKLGEWKEIYDQIITRIDLNLSSMAGKRIRLILVVRVNSNPGHSAGFWLMPQIRQPAP